MTLTFQINYRALFGQRLCVVETGSGTFGWTEQHPLYLNCEGEDFWTASLVVEQPKGEISYHYAIALDNGGFLYETGEGRQLAWQTTDKDIVLRDFWRAETEEDAFRTRAFSFRRPDRQPAMRHIAPKKDEAVVVFSLDLPQILPTQGVAVLGSGSSLGNWDKAKKLCLTDHCFPVWQGALRVPANEVVEYKYCIYDLQSGEVADMEWGENRQIWGVRKGITIRQNDRLFRRTQPRLKGAGVAVPVFSLRTEEGFGTGEFLDLKKLADWAVLTGQKMIQTLPINDTTITHTFLDSYPYKAVSVFALHPIYLHIPAMGKLTAAAQKKYDKQKEEFNSLTFADYPNVYAAKMDWFLQLYKKDYKKLAATDAFKQFFAKNEDWLVPYAEFIAKRDKQDKELYYYLQFHADKQLSEAVAYAHSVGVAIKGDIPIGISPESVDAASHPELFHLDASAGAPPDDFSISGQNWGFPTYNWEEMAKDNYGWWQRRFRKMQDYFDAYRIDHILGFFRIWQMRRTDVWGLCGHFSPAMPYSLQDLWNMGVKLDEGRMTLPYIRSTFLGDVFGFDTEYAKQHFLNSNDGYVYWFKDEYDNQVKVQTYIESQLAMPQDRRNDRLADDTLNNLLNGLLYLHCEVLFVRDQANPSLLHPRISIYQSHAFNELYDDQKQVIMDIYNDYFYRRHNQFWRDSAMRKLPTLIHSNGMLCCGEDLGMVPECVPSVMHELHILSLEIQRMPKDPKQTFAHPADAPYLSVCTTGTHDMNPLRAWWEEDRGVTQRFYNEQLGRWGDAPAQMTPEIAEAVINQHMYSPAMWVILPLQDWMAIDEQIRKPDAQSERINVPANPRHFWNYRMHLKVEDLLKADGFNAKVRRMTAVR